MKKLKEKNRKKLQEKTKQTMKKKRKDAAIKTEPVKKQEDEQSPEKVVKSKKGKCPKVKLDKKIKSAKGNCDVKSIKPKQEPVNNQLNTNENSLKPKVSDEELEIKPKTEVKDETKPKTELKDETKPATELKDKSIPKTEVKGETKPKMELTDEECEAIVNENAFKEVNEWMDPGYVDLPDQLKVYKDPVD